MHKHKLICLICIITVSIAASLEASAPRSVWEGSEIPLGSLIFWLGDKRLQVQKRVATRIKEKKVSGDQLLLAWAKLGRLLSRGGIINYDTDHWLLVRDAVFRLSALNNTSAGLQDTLKSDESVLALNSTIIQLGDENSQVQQQATTAIKDMKVSDDQLLLAWAKLARVFHMGGMFKYIFDHWLRMRDTVFRLINLDKALAGLLDTLKSGNKDESILARFVILHIDDKLRDSSIKPLPGTVPLLAKALEDQNPHIRETATQLLETISTHAKEK
ncbi:MAG: hypothetical protein OXP71_01635 [Candidatus Poribacteria bacterium]|nr:hypothetical protein [Candidatus Poribacteria bacterium]